ncbi:signal peptidase I [Virgibacillus sp. MSP4-1]|uniref:signal peptidase I SipW n=1 Tax=Virgibacillus sp. MSP4-1 TaxID=2700081 RepID=UPI0003A34687|nr:signal peptidase I [Virgibacillus sp. MSP4-1]QHS24360.1 signal peptidase I [Virgibacillus sp. MSP4-1]
METPKRTETNSKRKVHFPTKSVFKVIKNTLYLLVCATLLLMTIIVLSSRASGGEPQIFGYQFKTVLSGSMEPTFETGSIIVVKDVENPASLQKDDIITFQASENALVTHRIIEKFTQGENTFYRTQGDNNDGPDTQPVLSENVVAKYTGVTIPLIGYFLNFASSPMGTAILLIGPGLMLLGYAVYSFRLALKELDRQNKEAVASTDTEA